MKWRMKCVVAMMSCIMVLPAGDIDRHGKDRVYQLAKKGARSTPYVLAEDEIARMDGEKNSVAEAYRGEEMLSAYPAYTLYKNKKNESKLAADIVKEHEGKVFYKYGEKDDAHRYVTTGTILVTFSEKSTVDPDFFAEKKGLEYVKTVTVFHGRKVLLFKNMSDKNDVLLSSELLKEPNIIAAKPNWILPLKLF